MERYQHLLRDGVDLQLVMDAMYAALYYRLLIGLAPLTPEYTDALTDIIWSGIGAS
jgi:hypothetical protein